MSQIDLPDEILKKFTCLNCKNFLSILPVYVKSDGVGALCGRCQSDDNVQDEYLRDESYEVLSQFLLFPCINKEHGCPKKLLPALLGEHEVNCEFKKFLCPSTFYTNCKWEGPKNLISEHFTKEHPKLIIKNETFEMNFQQSVEEKLIMEFDGEIFIVKKEIDARRDTFVCSVELMKNKEINTSYAYWLRFESDNRNYFHKSHERTVDGEFLKLLGKTIKEKLQFPEKINVKIFLRQMSMSDQEDSTDNDTLQVDWDFLSELECPVCIDYMVPPIYQCLTGHSICKNCLPKVKNSCPTCRDAIQQKQNYTLAKLTQYIAYPCKFHKKGCKFVSNSTKIEAHEANCDFGPLDCPLKAEVQCPWNDLPSELVSHVENEHENSILKYSKVEIPFKLDQHTSNAYLIEYNNKLFKFCYKYSETFLVWHMMLIGTLLESQQYKYRIEVVDILGNKNVSISGSVGSFAATVDDKNCIKLSVETVRHFLQDKLFYFVKIIEN